MQRIIIKFSLVFLLVLGPAAIRAQQVKPASGGEASGTGGTSSYSIGQVIYTTLTGITGSVAQGVQQPFDISVITGFEEKGITLHYVVYPNPTANFLILEVENHKTEKLSYQLYDISGKLLESNKINTNKTTIDMSHLVAAVYLIRTMDGDKEIKTFRIIKN